jgi:nitroreductase
MIPLEFSVLDAGSMGLRAREFREECGRRRTVRHFSPRPVPPGLIEEIVQTAGTAPSGANKQPWRFVLVDDPEIKKQIRIAAEKEEKESYEHRMPQSWLDDLAELGTDWHKEFLEIAPCLIVVFKERYRVEGGVQKKNYYTEESVGIACGFLIAAIHHAGLVCLTHTPSPMNFLQTILRRPPNETPFLLIPVGYPAEDAVVPDIRRKALNEILVRNVP